MLERTFIFASIVGTFALAACAPEAAAPAGSASHVVSVIPGEGIASSNANPRASYLTSRKIENLSRLGALGGILAQLAQRTDGVLGTAESDGRLSVDELVALEETGTIEQLSHAERQALPDLWRLLEAPSEAPAAVTLPELDRILATDISEIATAPVEPATISIASLRSHLQRTAARLESVHDSDDDKKTVSKADVQAALANPLGFQPWEIEQLREIEPLFLERAGTKLAARVRVPEAVTVPTWNYPSVATFGVASLGLAKGVEYTEKRVKDATTGDLTVSMEGHVIQRVMVTLPAPNQLIMLDDGSDREQFVAAGVLETEAGTKTVEVWANGTRLGSYRAKLPAIKAEDVAIDLSRYVDYALVFGNPGAALKRNNRETTKSEDGTRFFATFTYTKDGAFYTTDESILRECATPPLAVAPGRYAITPELSLNLYPEGVITLSRQDGWTERAVFRANQWVLPSTSNLRLSYEPKENKLVIRSSAGEPIFAGPLTGSMRSG